MDHVSPTIDRSCLLLYRFSFISFFYSLLSFHWIVNGDATVTGTFLAGSMANNSKVEAGSMSRHRYGQFTTSCKIIARV